MEKAKDVATVVFLMLLTVTVPICGAALATFWEGSVALCGYFLLAWYAYYMLGFQWRHRNDTVPPAFSFCNPTYTGPSRFEAYYTILRHGPDSLLELLLQAARGLHFATFVMEIPGFDAICVQSPEAVRHVLETNFSGYEKGRVIRGALGDALGEGIFTSDGVAWKKSRRATSHLFSSWQLETRMTDVFHRHAQQLSHILSLQKESTFDIQRLMYCFTFDCIYEIAFGRAVDSLGGNAKDRAFQEAFDDVQSRSTLRFLYPWWPVNKMFGWGGEDKMAASKKVLRDYVLEVIRERKEEKKEFDPSDLISILEQQIQEEEGRDYSDSEIGDFITNFTVAGRDTTAALLTWTFYELTQHPEHVPHLLKEFKEAENPSDMHYTTAVLQEVLRLHPSVPLDLKFAVSTDTLPDGTNVRPGDAVMYNPFIFNRNPENFADPDSFLPERWLDAEGTSIRYDMKGFAYPAFNAGPRICLGRHMAMQEAKILLCTIMPEYDIKVVDGHVPDIKFTIVLLSKNGMPVAATPRAK